MVSEKIMERLEACHVMAKNMLGHGYDTEIADYKTLIKNGQAIREGHADSSIMSCTLNLSNLPTFKLDPTAGILLFSAAYDLINEEKESEVSNG